MRLIRVSDRTTTILFPSPTSKERPDRKTYDSCPGPIGAAEQASLKFKTHGLSIRPGRNTVHTLYVVFHGSRESIEVLELDAGVTPPVVTWIGCVLAPDPVGLNAVAGLPDGGFVATNFSGREEVANRPRVNAGEITGELWEWHPGTGWKKIPGSETSGPNGVLLSSDGKWLYVAAFGTQSLVRLSRGEASVTRDSVSLRIPGRQHPVGARRFDFCRGPWRRRPESGVECGEGRPEQLDDPAAHSLPVQRHVPLRHRGYSSRERDLAGIESR